MGKGKVYRDLFADRKETNINITVILKRVKKIMPNGKNNDNLILKIKKMLLRCNHRSIVYEVLDRKRR